MKSANPAAEFTLGVTPTSQVPQCNPESVTSFALSTDLATWQTVKLNTTSFFPHGIQICTGPTSNINTSPVSLIPRTPVRVRTTTTKHRTRVAHSPVVPGAPGTVTKPTSSTTTKKTTKH